MIFLLLSHICLTHGEVLRLGHKEYMEYVVKRPREYTTAVLFIEQCEICKTAEEAFVDIASSNQQVSSLLFIIVEHSKDNTFLFELHTFENYPVVAISDKHSISLSFIYVIYPKEDVLELTANNTSPEAMLKFMNQRTNFKLKLKSNHSSVPVYIIIGVSLAFLLLISLICKNFYFLFSACMLVYWFSISGSIYNLTNTNDEDFKYSIHPKYLHQHTFEGYFIGSIITLGGLNLLLIYFIPKIQRGYLARPAIIVSLGVMFYCVKLTAWSLFLKTSESTLYFFPPKDYIQGPLANDQGITV